MVKTAGGFAEIDASGCSEAVKLAVRFTALTAKRLCEAAGGVTEMHLEPRT